MNQLVPISQSFSVSDVEKVATAIARGGLFGSKDPYAVLTLCLLAQAEGQHPAVVFRDYHVINGKPAKKAEAMLRDFINSGGKVEWHTLDDTCADATFTHPSGSARIDWTLERAKKAGISTAMWSKYPRQMLRSRVISEGVRTVYPGATSGLYVPEEVEIFDAPRPSQDMDTPHHLETGEIIEAKAEKIPGITKIKERLRTLKTVGDSALTEPGALAGFNELLAGYRDDLTKIKEANHSWWTGDGEDFEGFKSWIIRRRAELAEPEDDGMYKMLLDTLKGCSSQQDLIEWTKINGALVEDLDGAEARKFQLAYDLHASGLKVAANVTAG